MMNASYLKVGTRRRLARNIIESPNANDSQACGGNIVEGQIYVVVGSQLCPIHICPVEAIEAYPPCQLIDMKKKRLTLPAFQLEAATLNTDETSAIISCHQIRSGSTPELEQNNQAENQKHGWHDKEDFPTLDGRQASPYMSLSYGRNMRSLNRHDPLCHQASAYGGKLRLRISRHASFHPFILMNSCRS